MIIRSFSLLFSVVWVSTSIARSFAGAVSVGPIEMTVNDLDGQVQFYTRVLHFELVAERTSAGGERDELLNLETTELKSASLKLGGESIVLTEHLRNKGRPIPRDSRSHDHWFQHIAIVVSDMEKAYAHLRAHSVKHISTGPQTLPEWNKEAAGIKAFYFRDPEDHVLEIIWFLPASALPSGSTPTVDCFSGLITPRSSSPIPPAACSSTSSTSVSKWQAHPKTTASNRSG